MVVIVRFPKFLGHVCGLRGNKVFEILVSGNLVLRIDFRTLRKVRKRLARRNLFFYFIFVKICLNLLGNFIGFDIYIINLISVLIFSLFFYPC